MIFLKKFALFFILIFSLFFSSAYAIVTNESTDNTEDIKVSANNFISTYIESLQNEMEILTEKLHVETNEEVRKELIKKIQTIMLISKANFTVKDYYQIGNKSKILMEVSHQENLSNYLDYHSRLKKAKEYYFQKEENIPTDLEITCLNETLALCKNKTTKCNFELEAILENDNIELEPLTFRSMFNIFKSFIF